MKFESLSSDNLARKKRELISSLKVSLKPSYEPIAIYYALVLLA